MKFTQRTRGIIQAIAVVLSLAVPTVMAVSHADARVGGGGSSGSRGSRTYAAPPSTTTAPNAAQPMNRTMTQPGQAAPAATAGGGFFNRPGMGMLGGLAAGFLGAGLLGMLFGGGLFSGLGGFASIIGLLLQIAVVVLVVRFAMKWWQRRNAPAYASAGPAPAPAPGQQTNYRSAMGFGLGSSAPPLEIKPEDYEAFERLLGDVQSAWSDEDVSKLERLATPEMASYFARDLADNKTRNAVNKVTGVKLLQGDLAEVLARGRQRLRNRGAALLAGRQDPRPHQRSGDCRRRPADRSHRSVDLRPAPRRELGTLGDPADQLIACHNID